MVEDLYTIISILVPHTETEKERKCKTIIYVYNETMVGM